MAGWVTVSSSADTRRPPADEAPWWRGGVFYQVDVRSFSDSDGDGVGDLNGLRDRLGYLELLGLDALWLTHLFRAPVGKDGDELDPIVGTLESFDLLVTEAHESGLRVVLDMAVARDLVRRPEAEDELGKALRFWLDREIDGVRLGAAPGAADPADATVHEIVSLARPAMDHYPHAVLSALIDGWWFEEYGRETALDVGIDMRLGSAQFDAQKVRETIDAVLPEPDHFAFPPCWSLGHATRSLSVTRFGGGPRGQARARAMAVVLMALPGVVGFDNGEELGLPDPDVVGQYAVRGPFLWEGAQPPFGFSSAPGPWSPLTSDWAPLTVEAQLEDEHSTLSLYRRAIEIRKEHPAMRGNRIEWYGAPSGCLAFRRSGGNLVCALNTSSGAVPLPTGEVLLSSSPLVDGRLPRDSAVWLV
jgi:alpha-glucosidase